MASSASVSSSTTIGSRRGHHGQQIGVEDQLGGRRVQAALHPARAVHELHAAHHRTPQREDALVGGLGVDGVRGAHVGRAVRHLVAPGELAAEHRRADVLRRAERRGPGLHVHVAREPAVDDRRPRPDDLREDHAGQRLGVLQCDRPGQRDRRHRSGQREGRHDDHLVAGGELDDALEHREVDAQQGRVDDGEDRWLALERGLVDPRAMRASSSTSRLR